MNIVAGQKRRGITLIEILVTIGVVALLACFLAPALSKASEKARFARCVSQLRQLSLSASLYAADNEDTFPPRTLGPNNWLLSFKPYFVTDVILLCPSSKIPLGRRSYFINAFNDYFEETLTAGDYAIYEDWEWPLGMPLQFISAPAETIAFGEKNDSSGHLHMDLLQDSGNDLTEVDGQRHSFKGNFAFVDGSVRLLRRDETLSPQNQWAVMPRWRREFALTNAP